MNSGSPDIYQIEVLEEDGPIARFLERDPRWTAYALADLDQPYRANATFIGARRGGELASLVMLYRLPGFLPLMPFGDRTGIASILERYRPLPSSFFVILEPKLQELRGTHFDAPDLRKMVRMSVHAGELGPAPSTAVRRLEERDLPAIAELYAHWGNTFFDRLALEHGVYYGAFDGPTLVSIAGTHVVSRRCSLAVIGGVFTHPEYRGRGLATATTGAVAQQLKGDGIELLVLNVKAGNVPAIAAYRRLGFTPYREFLEGPATVRRERRTDAPPAAP